MASSRPGQTVRALDKTVFRLYKDSMKTLTITDAKKNLGRWLVAAARGEDIGIVCGAQQPVVINNALRNVPEEGIYNWEPGSYFGLYRPDTFWLDESRRKTAGS